MQEIRRALLRILVVGFLPRRFIWYFAMTIFGDHKDKKYGNFSKLKSDKKQINSNGEEEEFSMTQYS